MCIPDPGKGCAIDYYYRQTNGPESRMVRSESAGSVASIWAPEVWLHSLCSLRLPGLLLLLFVNLLLILLCYLSKSLHKTPHVKCLLQFGGRKQLCLLKKLVCFPFLKIRVMQLIMCSFRLGCQEAQSQIVCSITVTNFLLPISLFLILPFNSFFYWHFHLCLLLMEASKVFGQC